MARPAGLVLAERLGWLAAAGVHGRQCRPSLGLCEVRIQKHVVPGLCLCLCQEQLRWWHHRLALRARPPGPYLGAEHRVQCRGLCLVARDPTERGEHVLEEELSLHAQAVWAVELLDKLQGFLGRGHADQPGEQPQVVSVGLLASMSRVTRDRLKVPSRLRRPQPQP